MNDYVILLKYALMSYEISDEIKIINQLRKIIDFILDYSKDINKELLDTIQLYIDNLKTYDVSIIIPEGKILQDMLK